MLSMYRNPAVISHHLSLGCESLPFQHDPGATATTKVNNDSYQPSPFQLTSTSAAKQHDSSTPIDDALSQLTDVSDDFSSVWSYGTRSSITPTHELEQNPIKMETDVLESP